MPINDVTQMPAPSLARNDLTPTPDHSPVTSASTSASATRRSDTHPEFQPRAARNSPAPRPVLEKALNAELGALFASLRKVSNVDARAGTEALGTPFDQREAAARAHVNGPSGSPRTQADYRQAEDAFWKRQRAGTSGLP